MQAHEVRDLGRLAGGAFGGGATRIEEMHRAIAGRVFASVGPLAAPVRTIHDSIARGVYSAVSASLSTAARAGATAISLTRSPHAPAIEQAPAGRIAIGALNGAFGDLLERQQSSLAVTLTVRRAGEKVELTDSGLWAAFSDATPRLAVFLHGVCETEEAWMLGVRRYPPYGARLRAELGYTPIYVRYNSGRHISDNGRELARVLDELTSRWPVDPHEIALIGHSMGGLVARSACHQGTGQTWVNKVRHVFMLGPPHFGALIEQAASAASAGLKLLPETRTLASALNLRSAGVKDLRYGNPGAGELPLLESAKHYTLSASGVHHFQLLNHPAVYEQLRTWLSERPELPPAPLMLPPAPADHRPAQRP